MNHRVWGGLLALALTTVPSIASAGEILLAPMIGRNVKSTTLTNITSLIYSELDFNSQVSGVNELGSKPSSLTSSCLSSTSCMKSVARLGDNEDQLLAGYITTSGGAYELKMVLFDITASTIVRTKSFTLGASPEALADGMTNVLKEVLTGRSKTQAVEEETFDFDFGDDDDDFDFDEQSVADVDDGADRRRAEEEARRRREAEEARRRREAEEARRREAEEARRREAEEARRREAEEARRREAEAQRQREAEAARRREAEEARRRREAAEASRRANETSSSVNLDTISFGSAAIIVDEEETPTPAVSDLDLEEEEFLLSEEEDDDLMLMDLDEPEPSRAEKPAREPKPEREAPRRTTTTRTSSSRTQSRAPVDDGPTRFELTARAGYSPYYNLGFVTYGAEGAIAVGETGLFVLLGVEAYSVQRAIPEEFQSETGQAREWNTIFPINAGLSYHLLQGNIQPYVGADAIFAQYYVNTDGGSWSIGARARTGVNLMVSDNFGFNFNAAVGFWSGKNWALIERDVKPSGFLPQISAGTVFSF